MFCPALFAFKQVLLLFVLMGIEDAIHLVGIYGAISVTFGFLKLFNFSKIRRITEMNKKYDGCKYEFVTGETVVINLNVTLQDGSQLMDVLEQLDRDLENQNRKETRRHDSFEELDPDECVFSGDEDINTDIYYKEFTRQMNVRLSEREKEVLQLVFIEDMPKSKAAEKLGISCARVTEIIGCIREKVRWMKEE